MVMKPDSAGVSLSAGLADSSWTERDISAMRRAICLAQEAEARGEVPVGAVVTDASGQVLGEGANRVITDNDPTAHAEIVALRAAARAVRNYRLPGLRLYVTLEPCAMCMGAMLHARLDVVLFGATDPKTGACGSVLNLAAQTVLNHQTHVRGGLLADDCADQLRAFFRRRRVEAKEARAAASGPLEPPSGSDT